MTEKIKLNDLLPRRIRKIHTGSELLLAYELDKYSKIFFGKGVELDVTIAKELINGEHFSFVHRQDFDMGIEVDGTKLQNLDRVNQYYFTGTVEGIKFKSESPEEVVYDFNFDPRANAVLHYDNRSAAYVSLVAFLLVRAKAEGVAVPKLRIAHQDYTQASLEYSDLMILKGYGNKLMEDLLEIETAEVAHLQPEWEAFVLYNRQRGVMNRSYTSSEKAKHLNRNFEVGDAVLLYKRTKGSSGSTINLLKACFPAVITYFDSQVVKLKYFPIIQTRLTRYMELNDIEEELEAEGRKPIYMEEDYERFDQPTVTYNLTEVGVDTCTWIESDFFIKPVDQDGSMQYFRTPTGLTHIKISTLDTIYAVFEDRGVEYNRDKFLAEYFNGRQPIYDYYKDAVAEAERERSEEE